MAIESFVSRFKHLVRTSQKTPMKTAAATPSITVSIRQRNRDSHCLLVTKQWQQQKISGSACRLLLLLSCLRYVPRNVRLSLTFATLRPAIPNSSQSLWWEPHNQHVSVCLICFVSEFTLESTNTFRYSAQQYGAGIDHHTDKTTLRNPNLVHASIVSTAILSEGFDCAIQVLRTLKINPS
jgi:hypothetical protein